MTHPKEPPRLFDPASGAPDVVRDAMRAGRDEMPDAAQIAHLKARVPIGAPPAGGSPPVANAAGAAGGSLIPSALTGAALAVVVVLGSAWRDRAIAQSEAPAIAPSAEVTRVTEPSSPAPARAKQPVSEALPTSPSRATATPDARVNTPPSIATSTQIEAPAPSSEAPIAAGGSVAPIEGESEVRLLQRAQDALATEPTKALALAGEHAQRFPRGALSQERELLAVAALVRAGQSAEARARANRFLTAFPRTAYRARLESLVGIESLQKIDAPSPPTP